MSTGRPTALVCDHALGFCAVMSSALARQGCVVVATAATAVQCLVGARELQPDIIVTELWLPAPDVTRFAELRRAAPGALIAVVSALTVEDLYPHVAPAPQVDLLLTKRERPAASAMRILCLLESTAQADV